MGHMKRAVSAAAAILMAAVLVPATASAADLQIGVTASPVISPTCPANAQGTACKIVLTQVTAYETLRDGVANPGTIKQSGVISAFTLGLAGTSLITPKVLAALDKDLRWPAGGTAHSSARNRNAQQSHLPCGGGVNDRQVAP